MAIAVLLAIFAPQLAKHLSIVLETSLIIILTLVFLKIDLKEIIKKIRDIRLMAYIVFLFLIAIPVLIYFIAQFFDENIALGLLLLTAMPAGASAPALTDLVKGNSALSTSITIITSLLAPFTVPLLFTIFTGKDISIEPFSMFKTLAILILLPIIFSEIIKKYFKKTVEKTKASFSAINIIILSLFLYTVIGMQAETITSNLANVLKYLLIVYPVFILLHGLGYLSAYGRNKKDKISFAVSKAYMNNGLGILLAAKFFNPEITLLLVLSEIPWSTLLKPFQKIINLRTKL